MSRDKKDDDETPAPASIDGARFRIGKEELAVITVEKAKATTLDGLTAAEREVCQLAFDGLSNQEIAERRNTSINTVENQLTSVFRKLGVRSRSELVALLSNQQP